jgi:hypothetical protein
MRLSTKRLAVPATVLVALAVAVPANSIAQPSGDDGASAAQRSKDPRDRGGKGGPPGHVSPRCRGIARRLEIAQANVSTDQAKLATAKQKLTTAKANAKAAVGKKAKAKAAAKVKKAKKKVKKAKAALKNSKANLRNATSQADQQHCEG